MGQGHKYALELGIIDSQFSRVNQIAVEFDLSGCLQSRCQQCVPVGNKTDANCIILLLINTSHSNSEFIPIKKILTNLRIIHWTFSQFVSAVLKEWTMYDVTN